MIHSKPFLIDLDAPRKNLLNYTRRAFYMITEIRKPHILDIGCGSGIPTMELAKMSDGEIIGVDIDQTELERFEKRIISEGLSDRVTAVHCSMFDLHFEEESFDIIWCEGSISTIGFEKGIREFGKFLKPGAYFVVHDQLNKKDKRRRCIEENGYKLLGEITLSRNVWYKEYYLPLKKQYDDLRVQTTLRPEHERALKRIKKDLEDFERHPEAQQSIYYVMRKCKKESYKARSCNAILLVQ